MYIFINDQDTTAYLCHWTMASTFFLDEPYFSLSINFYFRKEKQT